MEMPYVTGRKDYPVADPRVSSGLVAKMSPSFPHTAIDLGHRAVALPEDGSVPGMPGWKWIHTPGHTEGHVCLYREKGRIRKGWVDLGPLSRQLILPGLQ